MNAIANINLRICVLCWSRDNRQTAATFLYQDDPMCEAHRKSEGIELEEGTRLVSSTEALRQDLSKAATVASIDTPAESPTFEKVDDGIRRRKAFGGMQRRENLCGCGARLRPGWTQCAACKRGGSPGRMPSPPSKAIVPKAPCSRPGCKLLRRGGNKHPFCNHCLRAKFHLTAEGKAIEARVADAARDLYRAERNLANAEVEQPAAAQPVEIATKAADPKKSIVLGSLRCVVVKAADFRPGAMDLDPLHQFLVNEKPEGLVVDVPKGLTVRAFIGRLSRRLHDETPVDYGIAEHRIDGKRTGRVLFVQGRRSYSRRVQSSAQSRAR